MHQEDGAPCAAWTVKKLHGDEKCIVNPKTRCGRGWRCCGGWYEGAVEIFEAGGPLEASGS